MEDADALRAQGASVMHLAVNGAITGIIAVSDRIKSTTPEALARLKEDGIHVVMARGDGVVNLGFAFVYRPGTWWTGVRGHG